MSKRQGLIVGISGASGAAIGMRIVELLADNPHYAVHLVVSPAAERTLSEEVGSDAWRGCARSPSAIILIRTSAPRSPAARIRSRA